MAALELMKITLFIITCLLLANLFVSENDDVFDLFVKLITERGVFKSVETASIKGVRLEVIEVNKFDAQFKKTGEESLLATLSHQDMPTIIVSVDKDKVKSNGVGIMQRSTGKPYVDLSDENGDGVFDFISYSVLNEDGKWLFEVVDYGMDGQAEYKLDLITSKQWAYAEGVWNEVKQESGSSYIEIEKQKILLSELIDSWKKNSNKPIQPTTQASDE